MGKKLAKTKVPKGHLRTSCVCGGRFSANPHSLRYLFWRGWGTGHGDCPSPETPVATYWSVIASKIKYLTPTLKKNFAFFSLCPPPCPILPWERPRSPAEQLPGVLEPELSPAGVSIEPRALRRVNVPPWEAGAGVASPPPLPSLGGGSGSASP